MKSILVALLLTSVFSSGVCFGQSNAIRSGTTLNQRYHVAEQKGNQPVSFISKGGRALKVTIDENGNRTYTFSDGSLFGVYDKYLTRTNYRGKNVDERYRFRVLPDKLEAGTNWKVHTGWYSQQCGEVKAVYLATAKTGPTITISASGKQNSLSSFILEFDGTAYDTVCGSRKSKRTIIYSPELGDSVFDEYIAFEDTGFLAEGYRVETSSFLLGSEIYMAEVLAVAK